MLPIGHLRLYAGFDAPGIVAVCANDDITDDPPITTTPGGSRLVIVVTLLVTLTESTT
jgi:hypothetical protein